MDELVQRYAHAATSSNLKCDQYHLDTDILMAIALSGGLAAPLARVKYLHDATAYDVLLKKWVIMVRYKASVRHWKKDWNPKTIARISLNYWLGDQCSQCQGTGFPVLKGIPTRSAKACAVCDGSGRAPLHCNRFIRDPVLDMYQELHSIFDRARERAQHKLRGRA